MNPMDLHLAKLGMKPVYDTYAPLTSNELARLEQLIGSPLPADYRDFVSRFGCASFPSGAVSSRPMAPPPSGVSASGILEIGVILGGGRDYNILTYLEILEDRMPPGMVPIIRDDCGNFFLIEANTRGRVFFWSALHEADAEDFADHGLEIPDDLLFRNLALVSHSFSEFIMGLDARENL